MPPQKSFVGHRTLNVKLKRRLRATYYNLKSPRGFGGVSRLLPLVKGKHKREKIQQWLRQQESYALHFPVRRKYRKQKITVQGIHQQWEADLTFVRGSKSKLLPILVVIDCLSRRADARVLKSKKPEHTANAFEDILQQSPFLGRNKDKSITLLHPYSLRTDQGLEFRGAPFQRLMKTGKYSPLLCPESRCEGCDGRAAKSHHSYTITTLYDSQKHTLFIPNRTG
jgi:hypothetical protein